VYNTNATNHWEKSVISVAPYKAHIISQLYLDSKKHCW